MNSCLRRAFIVLLVFLGLPGAAQISDTPKVVTKAEVTVRVRYHDNNQPVRHVKVQLLSGESELTVAEDFTREEGDARFQGLSKGNYRVLVSGSEIEQTQMLF